MTEQQMRALKPGDIIRHKSSADAMQVAANHSDDGSIRIIAVRIVQVSNPIEWDQVDPCGRVISE